MKEIKIVVAKTKKDCEICSEFMEKLINYESLIDKTINSNVCVEELFEKNLHNEYFYIAYAKQEKPIGFIFGYLNVSKGKVRATNILNLEGIFVDENFRKTGVGKILLQSFEKWAKDKFDDFAIEITYINANKNAQKFYEKMGYCPVKTILRK
ncbi:MAG: GNAT family N-acetyltransferase [Clostridiales bacterium]|nr:GNAT family N-acetyltransferase [Clostridiales bacterium]